MESYLKGRPKTQKFTATIPSAKSSANASQDKDGNEDAVVRAKPAPDVTNAPDVDLVLHEGTVRKIVIHMPDGNILELECEYSDETAEK